MLDAGGDGGQQQADQGGIKAEPPRRGTDCVLWRGLRTLLCLEKKSIWAEFRGVLAHLSVADTRRRWRRPEDAQVMPGIWKHVAARLLWSSSPLPRLQRGLSSNRLPPPLHFTRVCKVDPPPPVMKPF